MSLVHIAFIHTPMPLIRIAEMESYWQAFDIQYHGAHPGLHHMERVLWELPHWIPWLGGVLDAHGFESLCVIDFYTHGTPFDGIDRASASAALLGSPADVYLFSPMTPNLSFALEIADEVKRLFPESATVFGGVVATPLYREVAAHRSVDYVVMDRGESALLELLSALEGTRSPETVVNLAFKLPGGEVATGSRRSAIMPAKDIPFPRVDLFPRTAGNDIRYIRQVYALGCPYRCDFCTIQTIGRKPDYFPIERVLAEIRAYRAYYGTHHHVYFGDETFTLDAGRTRDLCDALRREGGIGYDCQTRLNALGDRAVVAAMAGSGCRWIEIGIETGVQATQNLFKQRVRLGAAEDTLARLRDNGMATCSYVVNGFPDQTLDQMKASIDWIASLITRDLLQASYLSGLVPYPGSAFFARPEAFGMRLHTREFKHYNEELPPVFNTRHATSDEIYRVYLDGLGTLTDAMRKRPYFGVAPSPDDLGKYGAFWAHN